MDVSFILVEPAVPENIGAAARAIKTMAFTDLRLVKTNGHLADGAKWLAHGSTDILKGAKLFGQLKEAIADLDFTIGTTAKKRSVRYDYYSPEEARKIVAQKSGIISGIGLVFGREESGLTNEELAICDIASSIKLANPYPSLNLAQSVMLYAYVFSNMTVTTTESKIDSGNLRLYRELKAQTRHILLKLGISEDSIVHHRMMERLAAANEDDARLFLSFAKKFRQEFE